VQCTIDNAFNVRDLVLQELVKIIVVCYIKKLIIKIQMWYFCTLKSIKNRLNKIDEVVVGVYSGWDSFLLCTLSTQRSAWRWPYNWAETCSWNYKL